MKKYELWKDYDGCGYTFIPFDHRQRSSLTKGSRLVWTCSARSWDEACKLKNEHLGFEPYKPME